MTKKFLIVSVTLVILVIAIYSLIGSTIGNPDFVKLKAKIPDYFGWKAVVKELLYSSKVKYNKDRTLRNPKKTKYYNISSDGNNVFKLKNNNQLYITTKTKEIYHRTSKIKKSIFITGVTKDKKIKCFKSSFKVDIIINIKEFNKKCENAIFLIGEIKEKKHDTVSFFFGFPSERQETKNLMVISTTNFYNYTSNQYNKNLYNSESNFYGNLNNFPSTNQEQPLWIRETSQVIWNISELLPDFDVIMDYELEDISLEKYKSIIFPIHQEYISKNIMNKLITFLSETKNSKIFLAGGDVFQREVLFDIKSKIIEITYLKNLGTPGTYIDQKKHDINQRFIKDSDVTCSFVGNKYIIIGEVAIPASTNVKGYFNKIICDDKDNTVIPALTTRTYNNNGILIHITSEGVAQYFSDIPYLKKKIANLLMH